MTPAGVLLAWGLDDPTPRAEWLGAYRRYREAQGDDRAYLSARSTRPGVPPYERARCAFLAERTLNRLPVR